MPALESPAGLPCPAVADLTPEERRALTDLPGPRQSRVRQRDFSAVQRLRWHGLNRTELALFRAWYRGDLVEGGAWFSSTWPLPQGMVVGVRKFLGEPRHSYLGNGLWNVEVTCEVRGRGMLPQGPGGETPEIGWTNPITSWSEATILHSNAGIGLAFGAFGFGNRIYAGLVVDSGQTVEWFADWYPTAGGPAPLLGWDPDLRILEVTWQTQTVPPEDDPFIIQPARGELVLTATIDGVPIAVGQRLVAAVTTGVDYPELAWGPEP